MQRVTGCTDQVVVDDVPIKEAGNNVHAGFRSTTCDGSIIDEIAREVIGIQIKAGFIAFYGAGIDNASIPGVDGNIDASITCTDDRPAIGKADTALFCEVGIADAVEIDDEAITALDQTRIVDVSC